MNRAALTRIVWKEWRSQQPFLIAMAVLAVAVQWFLVVVAMLEGSHLSPAPLFVIACGAPVLYMAGCAATMFATEHETGTYGFHQALPVNPGSVVLGKFGFAIGSTVVLAAAMLLAASLAARGNLPPTRHLVAMAIGGAVTVLEMWAWGSFFSLLIKQPLRAALLAVGCQSLIVHYIVPSLPQVQPLEFDELGIWHYTLAPIPRALAAVTLLLLDARIGWDWLGPSPWRLPALSGSAEARNKRLTRRLSWSAWSRLVWQQWQFSRAMIFTLAAVMTGIVAVASVDRLATFQRDGLTSPVLFLLVVVGGLCGLGTFLGDQRQSSFRFLAERGVSPSKIWFSRQCIWFIVLILFAVAAVATEAYLLNRYDPERMQTPVWRQMVGMALGLTLLCYALGQWCSIHFRSPFVALAATLGLSIVCVVWSLFSLGFGISLWISVCPLPLIFGLASWRRAADWLTESRTRRSRLRAGLWLGLPGLAILASVVAYRAFEYPLREPGFDVEAFVTRSRLRGDVDAMQIYRDAWRQLTPLPEVEPISSADSPDDLLGWAWTPAVRPTIASFDQWRLPADWVQANEPIVEQVLEATRADYVVWRAMNAPTSQPTIDGVMSLALLLIWDGIQLESEGELDQALDRYWALYRLAHQLRPEGDYRQHFLADTIERAVDRRLPVWAIHPDQTESRLARAFTQLQSFDQSRPPRSSEIKAEYVLDQGMLAQGGYRKLRDAADYGGLPYTPREVEWVGWAMRWLPWELVRTRRVAAALARDELIDWNQLQEDLQSNRPFVGVRRGFRQPAFRQEALRTTPLTALLVHMQESDTEREEVLHETRRRTMRILLALQVYRQRQGSFPKQLDDLRGGLFAEIPLEPLSGRPPVYFPDGAAELVLCVDPFQFGTNSRPRLAPPGQPMLAVRQTYGFDRLRSLGDRREIMHDGERIEVAVSRGTILVPLEWTGGS